MAALTTTFAIASYGAYPNPSSSPSDATRAILAVSYGLLSTAPEAAVGDGAKGMNHFGFNLTMN